MDGRHEVAVEPCHHRLRGAGRRENPDPAIDLEPREPALDHGRHVRQVGHALRAGDRERLELARLDVALHRGERQEAVGHFAGEHGLDRRAAALVRDMRDVDPGQTVQVLRIQAVGAARADRSVVELARLALRERDELRDAVGREPCPDPHHQRQAGQQRDRHEVLERVVRQVLDDRGVDRVRVPRKEQRVPVGHCLGHGIRRNRAGRARPVLDQHRLAKALRQLGLDDPRDRVAAAAGRERDQQRDGPGGKVLRERA